MAADQAPKSDHIGAGFFRKRPQFSAERKIFLQIHRNTPENSDVHPIRRLARRTETYPILETFLFLITARRFGGVGALEGREKVPDHIFLQNKKKSKFVFLVEDYGWIIPDFSAKFVKTGYLTCDFLGDVEG